MIRTVAVLTLLTVVGGTNVSTERRDVDADRQAILALEQLWLNANDAPTLDRLLADDFKHPVVTGQFLTKEEHIRWMVAHPPPATRKARFEQLDVRIFGDVAIAGGVVVTEGLTPAPFRTIFTDVFVRRNGRWQSMLKRTTWWRTSINVVRRFETDRRTILFQRCWVESGAS